ncbi:hypothetical protein L1049_013306 [Liquidambar formosana]|uniref:Uncharacterized protein n=1 Tax=Liquidambar formosana TaxID=63359 RepID=A0AAP0RKC1_LIQFO
MGSNRSWFIIWVIFYLSLSSCGHASNSSNPDALDAFIHDFAQKSLEKRPTGTLYKVPLPANFSGMDVSVVRLRSASFWKSGANFSSFGIPPSVLPMPYARRLAIVYQNLGNWSSYYYKVPGHTLVAPVVGFMAYDAPDLSALGNTMLLLSIQGEPISVRFSQIAVAEYANVTMKCVEFSAGGSVKLSNMTTPNVCIARGQGHFSIVIPTPPPPNKVSLWKWWVVGFGAGFVGLVLVGLFGIVIFKLVKRKKIKDMEKETEKSVAFDSIWIGLSRMPSATASRTQPDLENEYAP